MKRRLLFKLGIFLLVWAAAVTILDLARYGLAVGHYFWFCNLALVAMGYGLVRDDRGLITAFLSITLFTETFWIVDNLAVLLAGAPVFGLVNYLYAPGFPLDEFVLAHYHGLAIPIGFVALIALPAGRGGALRKVAILNPLIFAVSYFAFGADQNVNCIHHSCFPSQEGVGGFGYTAGFFASMFALNLFSAWVIESYVGPFLRDAKMSKGVVGSMGVGALAFLVFAVMDVRIKNGLPQVRCEQASIREDMPSVSCRNISMSTDDKLLVNYRAINPGAVRAFCEVTMEIEGKTVRLQKALLVEPFSQSQFAFELENPGRSASVKVHGDCAEAQVRNAASYVR